MNTNSLVAFLFVGTSLVTGCAASVDSSGQGSEPEATATSVDKLTTSQCADQQTACLQKNPLFGLFVCPAQYTQCVATASNGLPAQVTSAISDAAQCTKDLLSCTNAAETPAATVQCATTEAACVASIVQINLPPVVTGTAQCVTDSVTCINASTKVSDLTTCANTLESCAVGQAQEVLPPQVGQVIGGVSACETALNTCITNAETPAAVAQCGATAATCTAAELGVTLPSVSITGVVTCAKTAASCTLDAETVADVTQCATTLTSCAASAAGVGGGTTPPPAQTCAQKFNGCLATNVLNFLGCAGDLANCKE
jgi:hypothetical protein